MSRERALIKRATEALKYWIDATSHSVDWELLEDLESYLSISEPEQDEEPVAWGYQEPWGEITDCISNHAANEAETYGDYKVPLYLHPAPRPEFVRLSEEEVDSLTYAPYEPYELICAVENRLVEKNRDR